MTLYTMHYAETIFKHLKQCIEKLDLEGLAGPRRRDCSYTSRTRKDVWKEYGDQYDPNLTDIVILDIRQFIQELDGVLLSIDSDTAEDLSKVADYMTALNLCYRQLSSGSVPTDKCEASFKELMSLRKARYMLNNAYQNLKDIPEMETIHHWFMEWDRRLYKCYIRTKLLFDEHSLLQYRKTLERENRMSSLYINSLVDYALMIMRFLKCLPTPTFKNYMSIKALVNERIVSLYSTFQRLMDLIDAVINDNDAAVELIATNLGIPAPGSDNTPQLKQSKKNEPGVDTRAHKSNVTESDLQSIFQYLDANKDRYLSFPGGDDYASFYSEDGTKKDVTVYLDNHEGMRAVIVCPDYDSVKPMLLHLAQMMQTIPEFLSISTKERLVVFPNNDGFHGTIRESNLHVKMDIRITYDDMVYHWKNGTLVEDEGNPIAKLLQDCGRQNQ